MSQSAAAPKVRIVTARPSAQRKPVVKARRLHATIIRVAAL